MSWYDANWKRRAAILIDNHGGASTIDVDAVMPSDWPSFWDNVQASGDDIRVTDSDGVTELTFGTTGFNATTKVGTINIDDFAVNSTTAGIVAWIYWDNSAAADARTAITTVSPKTGYIEIGSPGSGSEPVVIGRPVSPGVDNPPHIISKDPGEHIHVWFNLLPAMRKRRIPFNNSIYLETLQTATYDVLDSAGASVPAMVDTTTVRVLHPGWVRMKVLGGTDDANYVIQLKVSTTEARILRFYATVKVRDILPPT